MAWRHSGLSAPGVSHLKTQTPCQDSYGIADTDAVLALVVADGAGSAQHATWAAEQVAQRTVAWFQGPRALPDGVTAWEAEIRDLLTDLHGGLEAEAAARGCSLREFACTFLLAVVTPDALIGAQIGDGAIVYRSRSEETAGEITLLTAPHHGEYLNETVFLTTDDYLDCLQWNYHAGAPDALALFSDGLQMLALDMKSQPPTPYVPFFGPLFTFMKGHPDGLEREQKLRAFLESERVCARTDDDKTLVIAVWEEGADRLLSDVPA